MITVVVAVVLALAVVAVLVDDSLAGLVKLVVLAVAVAVVAIFVDDVALAAECWSNRYALLEPSLVLQERCMLETRSGKSTASVWPTRLWSSCRRCW